MYNTTINLLCIDNKEALTINSQVQFEKTKNKKNFNSYIQMVSQPLQTM